MAVDIPSTEPTKILKGSSLSWTRSPADFPTSEAWTLSYAIRGPASLDVTGTIDGDDYLFSLTTAQTDTLTPGDYFWQLYAVLGAERCLVNRGRLEVWVDLFDAAAGYDGRSSAEILLDAVTALLQGKANKDQKDIWVGDRRLTRMSYSDLQEIQAWAQAQVDGELAREAIEEGRPAGNKILVRFPGG